MSTQGARFHVLVPARLSATRLPGKPLLDVVGKPLVVRVLEVARASGAVSHHVATDDPRIAEVVRAHGGAAILTRENHASGTDRLAEAAEALGLEDDAIVLNLQGDEPLVPSDWLGQLAHDLSRKPEASMATLAAPIRDPAALFDPNAVKVVRDEQGYAAYFSRAPIPFVRGVFETGIPFELPRGVPFLRHIGLYAYRVGTLRRLTSLPPAASESAESLEQLRALHAGMRIQVRIVDEPPAHGVDTPEDLARVRAYFARLAEVGG